MAYPQTENDTELTQLAVLAWKLCLDANMNSLIVFFLIFERGAGVPPLRGGLPPHLLVHNLLVIAIHECEILNRVMKER